MDKKSNKKEEVSKKFGINVNNITMDKRYEVCRKEMKDSHYVLFEKFRQLKKDGKLQNERKSMGQRILRF